MLVAVYSKPDGGIAITHFPENLTEEGITVYMDERGLPFSHIVDSSLIPSDEIGNTYYDALSIKDGVFSYNLPSARKIRMNILKAMRQDIFKLVDHQRNIAVDSQNLEEIARVASIANRLREMPQDASVALEGLGNIESIASYIPSVFGEVAGR